MTLEGIRILTLFSGDPYNNHVVSDLNTNFVFLIFQVRAAIHSWRSKRQRTSYASGVETAAKVI